MRIFLPILKFLSCAKYIYHLDGLRLASVAQKFFDQIENLADVLFRPAAHFGYPIRQIGPFQILHDGLQKKIKNLLKQKIKIG